MGSRPSKQEPEHGPATRRGHEVKWHYLPQPVYVRAFGGVGAEPGRMRRPTSIFPLHGLSSARVPEDPSTTARAAALREYNREKHEVARQLAKGLAASMDDLEAKWPSVKDMMVAVVDQENQRVQILGEDGAQVQQLGVTGKMGVRVGMFTIPKACFFDKRTQDLFVTDNDTDHIGAPRWQSFRMLTSSKETHFETNRVWSNSAEEEKRATDAGDPLPRMLLPWGVAVEVKEGRVLVSDNALHCVHVFSPGSTGQPPEYLGRFGTAGSGKGELHGPRGITVDSVNNIIVADANNDRVQVFGSDGRSLGCIYGLSLPSDVAVDDRDNILVADTNNHAVKVYAPGGGEPLAVYGGRRSFDTPGLFNFPMSVGYFVRWKDKETMKRWNHAPRTMPIDTDDDRCIVVGDTGNHTIHVLTVWRTDTEKLEADLRRAAREEQAAERRAAEERRRLATQMKDKSRKGRKDAKGAASADAKGSAKGAAKPGGSGGSKGAGTKSGK